MYSEPNKNKNNGSFQSMGLSKNLLKGILNNGYKIPTPIQRKAIPEIIMGKDVVAMARTGSGKTAAFLIPMFEKLMKSKQNNTLRALILSPTRELAIQTYQFTTKIGKYTDFKTALILGGDKIEEQFEVIHENPDIIIATPGRFLHIIIEMNLKMHYIEYVVFDEADRLFEMGFQEQLNEILRKLPTENRQTLLFSATLPQSLLEFVNAGLQYPLLIRLDVEMKLCEQLKLHYFYCRNDEKLAFLLYLIEFIIKSVKNPLEIEDIKDNKLTNISQTLIFVATKHHVEYLRSIFEEIGYKISYVYSDLDQTARKINIAKFQNKKTSIMIVTDVAARGIDIPMLENVINFNFPGKPKLFIHRVGRCARAGNTGNAYSIVASDELPYLFELHEFLSKPLLLSTKTENFQDVEKNGYFGTIPQTIIDSGNETIETLIRLKPELLSMKKVQDNAYKQYIKSRQLVKSNAIKFAKNQIINNSSIGIHPILEVLSDHFKNVNYDTLKLIKNYEVKSTIFDINKSKKKRPYKTLKITQKNDGISNVKKTELCESLKYLKNQSKQKDKNFIAYSPANHKMEKELGVNSFINQASQVALDFIADDEKEIQRAGQKRKWDRKKKKFVNDITSTKKVKTESGHYINSSYHSNLYSKWLKKHRKVDDYNYMQKGENEENLISSKINKNPRSNGKYTWNKNGKINHPIVSKLKKTGLKTQDQILKIRNKKSFRKKNEIFKNKINK